MATDPTRRVPEEQTMANLLEAIVALEEFEAVLAKAENAVWQPHWRRDAPLSERLLRVGISKSAAERFERLFDDLEALRNGRPISAETSRLLADMDAAEDSAIKQLATIVARAKRRF